MNGVGQVPDLPSDPAGREPAPRSMHLLLHERRDIFGRFRLHPWLLQKTHITEPFNEAVLPSAIRNIAAIRQPSRHAAALRQCVPGMTPIAVNMHLDVGTPIASIALKYSIAQTA